MMNKTKTAGRGVWTAAPEGLTCAVSIILGLTFLGLALGLFSCKTRPDPAAPDPHETLVNPLVGVWREGNTGSYYFFRQDGTGGTAVSPDAAPTAAPDDYSFLFWRGQGLGVAASRGINHLVTIGGDTSNAASATVRHYTFVENSGGSITVTPLAPPGSPPVEWTRAGGSAAPLSLDNPFLGEWHALWNGAHGDANTWSFKFRKDGTVRTYHHGLHQFDNGYLVRGKVMALLGEWRFDGQFDLKYMSFSLQTGNGIGAHEEPADGAPGLQWDFERVEAALWK
jgi:hypothetical protein